jgi:prevent-host-death family protein
MAEVTIRDLRNHGGDVVDRVAAGERLVVTRGGKAVAELRPVRPRGPSWRRLPLMDGGALRGDLDSTLDPRL